MGDMTRQTTKGTREDVFNCITQESKRRRIKYPEHVAAIDTAEKRVRVLFAEGKVEESHILFEFTMALERGCNTSNHQRFRRNSG
jgi:hypothetical protein